jgi:hypothetical protein
MKTQKELMNFLKEYWKVSNFDFEAQFSINPKSGKKNFWDIKNPQTKQIILNPETQQPLRVGAPESLNLELGKYYKIRLFIPGEEVRKKYPNDFVFFVDQKNQPPEEMKVSPFQFVEQINQEYSSAQGIAKEALAGAVKRISFDINRKPETFIFELLQNADDYPDIAKGKVNIRFVFTDNFLIVSHNGLPFSPANVKAICSVDAGNKQFDMNKTGYKGIGFKSIFKFSNYVVVNSGGYTFRFDEFYHKKRGNETFWQLIPVWTKPEELPEVYNHPQFTLPNVSFCIRPSKSSVSLDDIQNVFKEIFRDERVLLFLRNVTSIDFSGLNDEHFTHAVSKSKWEVSDFLEVLVDTEIREIVNRQIKEQDGRVPDKFKDIETSTIQFATSISEGKIITSEDTRVFAYLPTDVNLGLPFLINGDFIPDGSRQSIHMDLEWNQYLFEEAGKQFALWLESLYPKYESPHFLKLIPDFGRLIDNSNERDKKLFLEKFKSGFEEMLSVIGFLPDLDERPSIIKDLTVDTSGLLSLLGEDDFRKYLFIEGPILAPSFADSPHIRILIEEYEFGEIITHESISSLLENDEFSKYLFNPYLNSMFISFLNEKGLLSIYSSQAIFLSKDGELKREDEVYFNLGEDNSLLDWLEIPILNDHLNKLDFLKTVVQTYSPGTFIKEEILGSAIAKTSAKVYQNNRKLFQLLFKHYETLPEKEFFGEDQFKAYPVFDKENKLISDFNSSSFYLCDTEINELMDNQAIPESLVTIIDPKNYFPEEMSTETFWAKFGVLFWSAECALPLANNIFLNSNVIHKHFNENQDYLIGNIKLWQFIYKTLSKESGENEKSYKEKASKLPVLTSNDEIESLSGCYLSADFTGTNSLEILLDNHPDIDINFVSKGYIQSEKTSDWLKIFRAFGVKTDAKDFVGQYIIAEIESVSEKDLVSYTQLLFHNRSHFKEEIAELKIKIKTESGTFVEPEKAIIGSYYTKESYDDKILQSLSLENLICSDYGSGPSSVYWAEFFELIGAKVLNTKEEVIQRKLDSYLNSELEENSNWDEHQVVVKELMELFNNKTLTQDHFSSLHSLNLFTKEGIVKSVANKLFFPSEYNPKIDFEKIITSESIKNRFISQKYLEISTEIKSLFKEIGVFQNFRVTKSNKINRSTINTPFLSYLESRYPYIKSNAQGYGGQHLIEPYIDLDFIEFIGSQAFSQNFWEAFLKNDLIRTSVATKIKYSCAYQYFESENLILWTIQNQNSIPCQDGISRKPSDVYSFKLNELLRDKSLLPAIDLSEISIQGESAEKILGINTEIDLNACFSIFRKEPSVTSLKKSNIWQTFIKYIEKQQFTPKETLAFSTFLLNGFLPNQLGEWKLISELYYVDQSIDIGITKAPNLIHDDLRKIANKLKVEVLTSEDFKPEFKNLASERFKEILISRLKFIALLESQEDTDDKKTTYEGILDHLMFYKVNKIDLATNKTYPPIVNSEKQFLVLGTEIYYLRGWNSPYSDELFRYLKKVFELKTVSEKTLKDILIWSELELFELFHEKNIEYPIEWNPNLNRASKEIERYIENEKIEEDRNDQLEPNSSDDTESSNSSNEKSTSSDTQRSLIEEKPEIDQSKEPEFENPFKDITPSDESFIRSIIKGDFELSEKLDVNTTAKIKTLMAIKSKYSATEISDEGRFLKAGNEEIIVRSAQNGLLYLDVYHWGRLNEPNVSLSIYTKSQIEIFNSQEDLIRYTKPNNKFGIVRMPFEYGLVDYNSLDSISDKGKWHYIFIVNENAKAAKSFKEVMDYSNPDLFNEDNF